MENFGLYYFRDFSTCSYSRTTIMRKYPLGDDILSLIDYHFDTNFLDFYQNNTTQIVFNWSHTINNIDLDLMFEDLKREKDVNLSLYFQKYKLKSAVTFINNMLISCGKPRLQYTHRVGFWRYYHY